MISSVYSKQVTAYRYLEDALLPDYAIVSELLPEIFSDAIFTHLSPSAVITNMILWVNQKSIN
jgi:hypothetical protein